MKTSETITKIAGALLSVQNEFVQIRKDKTGFLNQFASLESLIKKAKPILTSIGVNLLQPIEGSTVETWLIHAESGEYFMSSAEIPSMKDIPEGGKLHQGQKYGMNVTYQKRYSLASMLSWGTGDEDLDQSSVDKASNEVATHEELANFWSAIQEIKTIDELSAFCTSNSRPEIVKDLRQMYVDRKNQIKGQNENS